MKGYIIYDDDCERIYIPGVLAIKSNDESHKYYCSPNQLENISLMFANGIILEKFKNGHFSCFESFNFPEIYIKGFLEICSSGSKRKIKRAVKDMYSSIKESLDSYGDDVSDNDFEGDKNGDKI